MAGRTWTSHWENFYPFAKTISSNCAASSSTYEPRELWGPEYELQFHRVWPSDYRHVGTANSVSSAISVLADTYEGFGPPRKLPVVEADVRRDYAQARFTNIELGSQFPV